MDDYSVDLIFYTRCLSHEWMAGSYLARNTPGARRFLAEWVTEGLDMGMCPGIKLINHDQSAIHETFMRLYGTLDERRRCREYYLDTTPFGVSRFPTNFYHVYVACARHFLDRRAAKRTGDGVFYYGGGSLPRVKVLPHFYPAWVRDGVGPVTSKWAPSDFMFHWWKDSFRRDVNPGHPFPWDTPFKESFAENTDLSQCVSRKREEIIERYWRRRYIPELMLADASELKPYFEASLNETNTHYAERLAKLPNKGRFDA